MATALTKKIYSVARPRHCRPMDPYTMRPPCHRIWKTKLGGVRWWPYMALWLNRIGPEVHRATRCDRGTKLDGKEVLWGTLGGFEHCRYPVARVVVSALSARY